MADVFAGEQQVDVFAPTLSSVSPVPGSSEAALDTTLSFRVDDVGGNAVDISSLNVSVNGAAVVTDNVAVGDCSGLIVTPSDGGYDVSISLTTTFSLYESVSWSVSVSDNQTNAATYQYQFQTTEGVIEAPGLSATVYDGTVRLSWSVSAQSMVSLWQLRRSRYGVAPASPDDGELVYQGVDTSFVDSDVETGVVYAYSIFLIRRDDVYAPYDVDVSSAFASLRALAVTVPAAVGGEYVPLPGEIGATVNPVPAARLVATWGSDVGDGSRRTSDVVATGHGALVVAAFDGVVSAVDDSAVTPLAKAVAVRNASGVVVTVDPVRAKVAVGDAVKRGRVIAATLGGQAQVSAHKETGGGRVSMRPMYVYSSPESKA